MTRDELLMMISSFYYQKIQEGRQRRIEAVAAETLYEGLATYLWERYEIRAVAVQKCGEVLQTALEHMRDDEFIQHFAWLLQIKDESCRRETPQFYLRLIQDAALPLKGLQGLDYDQCITYSKALEIMKKYEM
jgi:hypothetical protein